MDKIRVLIVDDSKTVQMILAHILKKDEEIEVVGFADNPLVARELIKQLNPDVITLDVEMPEMDGITFLEKLMRLRPMPVVMCSTLTKQSADVTIEALRLGAVDFIEKPSDLSTLTSYHEEIVTKIKVAASTRHAPQALPAALQYKSQYPIKKNKNTNLIAIGASTGGIEALISIFKALPKNMPPIVVTQHLPAKFTASFAEHANKFSQLEIKEAKAGEFLEVGHVYIAPGNFHLLIVAQGNRLRTEISQEPQYKGHRPSVDRMFQSIAAFNAPHTLATILTGMGADGAEGLLQIRKNQGITIAQDQASSIVWGMPRAAVQIDAADYVLSLSEIPRMICQCIGL